MPTNMATDMDPVQEKLWEWASKMEDVSFDQFGLAIVGIGALFFAYGQVPFPHTRLLIALIGLAASVVLWFHMYATRKQYLTIKELLRDHKLVKAIVDVQSWKDKGVFKIFYHHVSRVMSYFMALVSWAWLAIILARLGISFQILVILSWIILVGVAALIIIRRYQDLQGARSSYSVR